MKRLVGLPLILAASTLLAQPAPSPAPAPTPDAPPPTGDVSVQLSVEDMNLRLVDYERQANEAMRIVLNLQAQARKEKDVIKLTCINDKLLHLKATRNIFDLNKSAYEGIRNQENFAQIEKTSGDIRKLREEAQSCAGESELPSDEAPDYTAPDIPDDPSDPLFEDVIEPPGYASPYA